jgi:hypothetical protein
LEPLNEYTSGDAIVIVTGHPQDLEIINISNTHILINLAARKWSKATDLMVVSGDSLLKVVAPLAAVFMQAHPHEDPNQQPAPAVPANPITIPSYFKRFTLEGQN